MIVVELKCYTSRIYPTIETLFIGCGDKFDRPFPESISKYFREKGIAIEPSDSVSAAGTFNILNGEGRNVAAALLTKFPASTYPEDV